VKQKAVLHVHFGADHACCVTVHAVPCDEDGALSERWYTDHEYQQFKKDQILSVLNYTNAQRTIASKSNKPASKNSKCTTFDPTIYTIRGLEHKCGTAASLKYHRIDSHTHRNIVRNVIFTEQQRQRQHENHQADRFEKFREVSAPHTKNECDRARWRAQLYDQEEERTPRIRRRRTMRMHTRSHSQPNITMKRNNSSRRFLSLLRSNSSPKQQKK